MLRKVISGGQTGADTAGLFVGKRFGLETGGMMPKGFVTLAGPRPDLAELYGMKEYHAEGYVGRTFDNVKESDGTIRLAGNFESKGELCTMKAIEKYQKPYFDVDLSDPPELKDFIWWMSYNKIHTLNVAGNSEQTFLGAFKHSVTFLTDAFFALGLEMQLEASDILFAFGVENRNKLVLVNGQKIDKLKIRATP